jgi:hypothetical protein
VADAPVASRARVAPRPAARHEGFLRHRDYLYLKVAGALCLAAVAAYALTRPAPRHSGGDWLGYTLGTISALLIVWLTLLGLRKRAITPGRWSLKAWTSAHVYLGLSLLVLATLHTGFQFGWNVHTLAYVLMLIVIGSGVFGIYVYGTIPRRMSDNRDGLGGAEMLAELDSLDAELRSEAQPLSDAEARVVREALASRLEAASLLARLKPEPGDPAARRAIEKLRSVGDEGRPDARAQRTRVIALLERRQALTERARAHIRYRVLLELWLYVHVPVTFALLAALVAHIILVFSFW